MSCDPEPIQNGEIKIENSCGSVLAAYAWEGDDFSVHFSFTNTNESDTTFLYLDDVLLQKMVGTQGSFEYSASMSQSESHLLQIENSCGGVSEIIGGEVIGPK